MKKLQLFFLSLLSGCLLALSYPAIGGIAPLAFIALGPLLFVEDHLDRNRQGRTLFAVLGYAYLTFFSYNLITTWWILFASKTGMALAVILNSLMMAIVFLLFHFTKRALGAQRGYFGLIFYWIAFEWVHLNWELSWPWLTLGNIFSTYTEWVQWYEYTGVLGGSFWILCINLLLYVGFRKVKLLKQPGIKGVGMVLLAILFFFLPYWFSHRLLDSYEEKGEEMEVVLIQPNIDPYEQKFPSGSDFIPYAEQVQRVVDLAREKAGPGTDLIAAPETVMPGGYWEGKLEKNPHMQSLRSLLHDFPETRVVAGMTSYKKFDGPEKPSAVARKYKGGGFYEAYNTALHLEKGDPADLYHKSKLVLGVEKMPFASILAPLQKLAIDLGGTSGSLGVQEVPSVFNSSGGKGDFPLAPLICYESIYGGYVTEYVRKGAEVLVVITNDGWWSNTPGYEQHLHMARLRAIETRRSVVRSANTGISCFIDQKGNIVSRTDWWVKTALKGKARANDEMTFYAKVGDYPGRLFGFFSLLLLLLSLVRYIRQRSGIHPNP